MWYVLGVVGEKIKVNNFHSLQPPTGVYWAGCMSQNVNTVFEKKNILKHYISNCKHLTNAFCFVFNTFHAHVDSLSLYSECVACSYAGICQLQPKRWNSISQIKMILLFSHVQICAPAHTHSFTHQELKKDKLK